MVQGRGTLKIQPTTLTDLTVIRSQYGEVVNTLSLSDFTVQNDYLESNINFIQGDEATISSTGYQTQTITVAPSTFNNAIVLVPLEFSNIETNSIKYYCKDETARNSITDINTTLDGKVSKAGDTMTGVLKISAQGVSDGIDDCRCILKNTEMEFGVTPISNLVSAFGFTTKNNEEIGAVYCRQRTDSSTDVSISCKSLDGTKTSFFRCGFNDSGTSYASCPTPEASSNNTYIATTKWVKDFAKTSGSNYMSTFSKAQKGYYKFTNGLIINWGETEFAKTGTEVSFATAFTSTNYQVVFGEKSSDAGNTSVGGGIMSKNTSKFKAYGYKSGGTSATLYWVAIGY